MKLTQGSTLNSTQSLNQTRYVHGEMSDASLNRGSMISEPTRHSIESQKLGVVAAELERTRAAYENQTAELNRLIDDHEKQQKMGDCATLAQ